MRHISPEEWRATLFFPVKTRLMLLNGGCYEFNSRGKNFGGKKIPDDRLSVRREYEVVDVYT